MGAPACRRRSGFIIYMLRRTSPPAPNMVTFIFLPVARHLIAIGFDAKGLPISLFAVNSWVTGDLMLSADSTAWLLSKIDTDTGHPEIDVVMVSLVRLCQEDIEALLAKRDGTLASRLPKRVLEDRALEILTEIPLNLDAKIANVLN